VSAVFDTNTRAELRWLRPDSHHIRTDCGRYTVARVDMGDRDDYVAWRLPRGEHELPRELLSARVPKTARESDRLAAIKSMQAVCAEDLACEAVP
jgi:hypothetical protein